MKKIYSLLITIGLALPLASQEEPCPPTGITTNPDEPVNGLHPNYINDYFDWRKEDFEVDFAGGIDRQSNPYNSNNGGVAEFLYRTDDFEPADGWELLYVDFGLDKFGNPLPSGAKSGQLILVLYNKYRSIIRVFAAIDELDQNTLIEMELFVEGDYNTALLASIDKVQQPLESFDPKLIGSNVQEFTNGGEDSKHWHYADFPVNYDPCTCEAPVENSEATSTVKVKVNLIDRAKIELNGSSSGTIEIMAEKDNSPATFQDNWDDFYGTVKKSSGVVSAGTKGFKDFSVFKGDAKNTANGKGKETAMKSGLDNLGDFLTDNIPALKFVPYASEALAILDFFVGGSKKDGPQQVTFPPMSIQMEHSFSGTISSNYNYIRKPVFTPGSSFTPDDNRYSFGDDRYPIYNEILGVYTLLEKPKIEFYRGYVIRNYGAPLTAGGANRSITRKAFMIDQESIKVALNPASGLTLVESYVQLNISMPQLHHIFSSSGGTIINDTL